MQSALGRVLIVDDEPDVRTTLREVLISFGYVVEAVGSGAEALRLMPVVEPDVVLLDVMMPDMSGDQVLEQLRREYSRVRVVMVTANEDEDRARALLSRGAFDYVRKPFDLQVLDRVVMAALGASGR